MKEERKSLCVVRKRETPGQADRETDTQTGGYLASGDVCVSDMKTMRGGFPAL